MKKIIYLIFIFCFSCDNLVDITIPDFNDNSFMEGTMEIPSSAKAKMEGIYKVKNGQNVFGSEVVVKWNGDNLSIFGEKQSVYFVTTAGSKGTDIRIEGYWRYAVNTETGLSRIVIASAQGGEALLTDTSSVTDILIDGYYGNGNATPNSTLSLEFDRSFSKKALETKFYIVAHRGGGRTADLLSASENSINMLSLAEKLGANAIEIDVKLSKDRIPFLYHDNTINLRLVQKSVIWGNIEDFTFAQLRTLITLINGERIPSLKDALEYVLEQTQIEFIWLDMKSSKNDMQEVITMQKDILHRAEMMGRKLEIFVGLPSEDKINQYLSHPDWQTTPSLNEFDIQDVRYTMSEVWGPRWTLGMQSDKVIEMHNEGRRAITWTMDDPAFISKYISEGHFDGMVTNYPTLVAHYHYTR